MVFTINEYTSAQKVVQPILVLRYLQMDLVSHIILCLKALSIEFWIQYWINMKNKSGMKNVNFKWLMHMHEENVNKRNYLTYDISIRHRCCCQRWNFCPWRRTFRQRLLLPKIWQGLEICGVLKCGQFCFAKHQIDLPTRYTADK